MVKSLDLSCVVCLIKLMGLFRFCEQQVMCLRWFDEEEREDTIKSDFAQFLRILGAIIFSLEDSGIASHVHEVFFAMLSKEQIQSPATLSAQWISSSSLGRTIFGFS